MILIINFIKLFIYQIISMKIDERKMNIERHMNCALK